MNIKRAFFATLVVIFGLYAVPPTVAAIKDWSTTPSANATADSASGILLSEGQAPGSLNDSIRAIMAVIKGDWDALGFTNLNTAWSSTAIGASSSSGSLGNATGTRRHRKVGKLVFVEYSLTVTSVGTAGGFLIMDLPHASATNFVLAGKENALSGAALTGFLTSSGTTVGVSKYDGSFPTASGGNIVLSGVYETTE